MSEIKNTDLSGGNQQHEIHQLDQNKTYDLRSFEGNNVDLSRNNEELDLRNSFSEDAYDANQVVDLRESPSIEYDDNGNAYKQNGELLPNTEYTIRGYDYKTDEQGRIINASGELKWKDHEGRLDMPDNIHDIGKGSERPTDDRGHLIADEFNGAGGKENLVPMDSYVNQHGDYRKLEQEWEKLKYNGETIIVDIDVDYNGDSRRPESFTVAYDTGGEHYEKTFLNEDTRGEV